MTDDGNEAEADAARPVRGVVVGDVECGAETDSGTQVFRRSWTAGGMGFGPHSPGMGSV